MRARQGSITAEWALALPAVMVVLALVLGGIRLGLTQSRLDHVAADAVRMASLGASDSEVRYFITTQWPTQPVITILRDHSLHRVCVDLSSHGVTLTQVELIELESRMCALLLPPVEP